jgi:hypothetical protein
VLDAPAASCALGSGSMRTSIHSGGTGNIRHSPRDGVTAYGVLPRRRIRLASVAGELTTCPRPVGPTRLRRLDTSNGCQDHTLLPSASAPFVARARLTRSRRKPPCAAVAPTLPASTASHPNVRDDSRSAPRSKNGMAWLIAVATDSENQNIFSWGWTTQITPYLARRAR